jgi:hypothetical protein
VTSPGGTLTERLQLIVDATTSAAETKFQRLTGTARETGDIATASANSVRDAADRVAAARDRELTSAGALRVAETRLRDLREGGRARADQIAAAEERVAGAQRNLQLAVRNTARATEDQTRAQASATEHMDRGTGSGGRLSGVMDKLTASAVALGGAGLVAILRGIGDGFATGARDAGQLATSLNATVGEASAFLGLVGSLGLDLNDLLEIQAEFAQKVTDNGTALRELGVQTERNADGTINWAGTLVDFLDQLQGVKDATERNRLGFQFLGEEGFKQLSRLVNSGTDVRDALEKIGVPFTEEDVRMAAEYDAAMLDLTLTSQRTQQQLGRLLLPVLTGMAEGLGNIVDAVEDIPAPLAIATVAALALGLTGWNPTAIAGARLSGVMAAVNSQLAIFRFTAATAGIGAATLTAGMSGASAAGSRLLGVVGGPLGASLIGAGVLYSLVSDGVDRFRESSRHAAQQLEENKDSYTDLAEGARALGEELAEEAGTWDGLAASRRGASNALKEEGGVATAVDTATGGMLTTLFSLADQFSGGELAAQGFTDEIEKQRRELGAFGAQQETTQTTTKALNDLIAEGTTSGREFGEAVQAAAEAEAAQTRTTDLAKAALDAYNATTRDAVQTQLDLFTAQLQQRDGLIGLQQTVHETRDVVDDLSTPWNEVEEATNRVIGAALDYGSTAADAAVQAARATGTVVDELTEAQIRADATVGALRESLNAPGLTDAARTQITDMITALEEAQAAGDVEAVLRLTGVGETETELSDATRDRDSIVRVETRNGPAVVAYLDRVTAERLTLVRVESRNGPAVDGYLGGLARERLAIIRVETRGGPDVDEYLDRLAGQSRTAYIDVRQRGAAAVRDAMGAMRGAPGALTTAGMVSAPITIGQLIVQPQVQGGGQLTAGALQVTGEQVVGAIRTYERRNGIGWRS